MLIRETVELEGGDLLVARQHDVQDVLDRTAALRSNGVTRLGESVPVAEVPLALVEAWALEAGVRWDDRPAMRELLKKHLLSGEYSKLRIWEGRY